MIVFTALLVVVGIAGTLLPIVPGIALVWGSIVFYGLVEGFGPAGWVAVTVVTLIGAAGLFLGVRMPQRAAAGGGIGWRGQLLALGLAVVGFFVIPVLGAAIGFVAGVYLSALLRDRPTSWAVTKGTIRSLFVASGIQFAAAFGMGIVWAAWVVAVRLVA